MEIHTPKLINASRVGHDFYASWLNSWVSLIAFLKYLFKSVYMIKAFFKQKLRIFNLKSIQLCSSWIGEIA